MATWHQKQRPVKLTHPTLWTSVSDSSEGMMSLGRHTTEEEAKTYCQNVKKHHPYLSVYVLKPENQQSKNNEVRQCT